jgi:CubicO group peptidase (beta-lactamase class C family)
MDRSGGSEAGYLASRRGAGGPHSPAIDALFADCDGPGRPGLALAVLHHGRIIHQSGYGVANVEDDVPFTPQTVLHLGSTTKHFAAVCALILEDRGAMSLEDPITRWVDDLPPFYRAITLRHLLSMTSGLPDGLNLGLFCGSASAGLAEAAHLDYLRRLEQPMFPPGEGLTYSNSNYLLASKAIERAAGAPLGEVMRREIFEPLAMRSAALSPDTSIVTVHKARGYAIDADGRPRTQPSMSDLCGDGGVITTLGDLVTWARTYGEDRFAGGGLRARLEAEGRLTDGAPTGYGLGMGLSRVGGLRKVAHGGGMPGYLADFAYVPEEDLFVLWLANRMDPALFERTDRVIEIVRGRDPTGREGRRPDAVLEGLEGVYVDRSLGCTVEFEQTPEGTVLHVLGERLILAPTGEGAYRPTKSTAYFPFRVTERRRGDRPIVEMKLSTAAWAELTPWEVADAVGVELAVYAGEYRSSLLGESHFVRPTEGGLEVTLGSQTRKLLWTALKPRGGDLFSAVIPGEPSDTDVSLLFRRSADGVVSGFDYNLSRTRGVRFDRR